MLKFNRELLPALFDAPPYAQPFSEAGLLVSPALPVALSLFLMMLIVSLMLIMAHKKRKLAKLKDYFLKINSGAEEIRILFEQKDEYYIFNHEFNKAIDTKKEAEELSRQSLKRHSKLFEEAPIGIYTTTRKGEVISLNLQMARMLDYDSVQEAVGDLESVEHDIYLYPGDRREMLDKLDRTGVIYGEQYRLKKKDGSTFWAEVHSRASLNAEGKAEIIDGFLLDISEQVELRKRLEEQANTDGLTGIYNRRYFVQVAELELQRTKRYQEELSLAIIDIDHFKKINDTFGHSVGDDVLKALCLVTSEAIRGHDIFGRIGGEEFAILMPQTDRRSALDAADRIRDILESSLRMTLEGKKLAPTVSIGVTTAAGNDIGLELQRMLDHADKAMYKAKAAGRNCVRFSGP